MPKDLFSDLNDSQVKAVKHYGGPALVVAGPGSGKTRVLTHRVAYLIQEFGVPQEGILCVTFTNKAAKEIKTRVDKLLGSSHKLPWGGTFHSVCSKILRKNGYQIGISPSFAIFDTDDQSGVVKQIIKDFGIDSKKFSPHSVLAAISSAKSELIDEYMYEKYARGYFQRTVANIFFEYQKRLKKENALDFDDLLVETVNLLKSSDSVLAKYQSMFMYILIDEYQDTNKAQYTITKLLSASHRNLFVVGDMSQSIYSFRGADYRNILNFQNDYPDAVVYNLEQNYRSTQTILDAAKNVIKNNTTHIPLDLWTQNGEGEKLIYYAAYDDTDEIAFVTGQMIAELSSKRDHKDIAVLYRTNAQSRGLEEALIKSNIPYKIVGGQRFYARREIKDVIAYLRVIHNPLESTSWDRIINIPPKGIGQKSKLKLSEGGWDLNEIEIRTGLPFKKWVSDSKEMSTLELMDDVIEKTGYIEWIDDGTEENKQRIENINELRSVASRFLDLPEFLENVALIESSNKTDPDDFDAVTLMTAHASKGLEFPVVFIVGLEEGLFPHGQSIGELEQLEEERRLCYVALTRAMERVYLTNARSRLYFGNIQSNMPSRFLSEIPEELISSIGLPLDRKSFSRGEIDEMLDEMDYERGSFSWEEF